MKKLIFFVVAFLPAIFLQAQTSGLVRGNGDIQTSKRAMGIFTSVAVEFPAEVEIVCKSYPFLEITSDKNILDHIQVSESGSELRISQKGWIEASKGVVIKIGAAFIDNLETNGYGDYKVTGIDVPTFNLVNPVGSVSLEGKARELKVNLGTGSVDASRLTAESVLVHITSWGTAHIFATDKVEGYVAGRGKVVYSGNPARVNVNMAGGPGNLLSSEQDRQVEKTEVVYIDLKVYNNRISTVSVVIQGPPERQFSYGTNFMPLQSRKERFPVGTEIYKVDSSGERGELLLKVEATFAGKSIHLFK